MVQGIRTLPLRSSLWEHQTGGLDALQRFFGAIPSDSDMAFVVIQHLDPDHATLLPELLGRATSMPVQQVEDGVVVKPNSVYVIPPNTVLTIVQGALRIAPPAEARGHRMPIDQFFHSLAEDQGEKAIAVVLSGTGSDGMLGVKSIKERGGIILAQESPQHSGMPQSTISTGLVDLVLVAEKMPEQLNRYANFLNNGLIGLSDNEPTSHLEQICDLLRERTGHDFSGYKQGTLLHRIQRRVQVLGMDNTEDYLTRLQEKNEEARNLFQDLLIGVTQFFRDPDAFATLKAIVVPKLFQDRTSNDTIRIWVPGSSTGEEAYSLAILFLEHASTLESPPYIQLLASDIDDAALKIAREARYPEGIVDQVSDERMEQYFTWDGTSYRVNKDVRDLVLFSSHNLIKDPPFSSLDMISCRNLLIYLGGGLQRRLVPLFHFALSSKGYLFLGPSENLPSTPELFNVIDKPARIYRARQTSQRTQVEFPVGRPAIANNRSKVQPAPLPTPQDGKLLRPVERVLLERFIPTCVVVTAAGDVEFFSGRTGRYVEPAVGAPSNNIFNIARPGLRLKLRAVLNQALSTKQEVRRPGIAFDTESGTETVDLTVRPLTEVKSESELFIVVFTEAATPSEAVKITPSNRSDKTLVKQLEEELHGIKDELQATIEQLETANEELNSSNEELLSMNEELQSSNEELQTSKEELQSTNEELNTVNTELRKKIEELDRANADLQNLFASTRIAVLFLDRKFRIERFTPAATDIFPVVSSDIGRPIADITSRLAETDIIEDFREVVDSLVPMEREVSLADQNTQYIMRVRPYRTLGDRIDGVVVTFNDVTVVKRAENEAHRQHEIIRQMADAMPMLFASIDRDERYIFANDQYRKWFGLTDKEVVGRFVAEVVGSSAYTHLRPYIRRVLQGERFSLESTVDYTHGGQRDVRIEFIPNWTLDEVVGYYAMITDISQQMREKKAAKRRELYKDALARLAQTALDTRDITQLMERAVRTVSETLGLPFAKTLQLQPDGRTLLLEAGIGWQPGLVGIGEVENSTDSQAGYTLLSNQPIIVDDFSTESRFRAPQILIDHGIVSGISVVIEGVELDRPYGVFGAHSTEPQSFTIDDTDFLQRVANLLTAALHRERYEATLRDADQRKDEFLAMLAHELRNPLAPLQNAASLLEAPVTANDVASRFQPMIKRQVDQMTRLLDDLLDVSRVSNGKITLRIKTFPISEAIFSAIEECQSMLEEKGQCLELSIPSEPIHIEGDSARLTQVISNLLHNSAKFSDKPGKVQVTVQPDTDGVVISVQDSGLGIPTQLISKVFDLFHQGDNSTSRARGGLGIGLTLVKTIIEMHHGKVWVTSAGIDQGSEFHVWLPVTMATFQPPTEQESEHGQPRRILVIDDNRDAAETFAELLKLNGHDVQTVNGGQQALGLVSSFVPQVILLDLGMPEMDGYETARQLRNLPQCRDAVIIALTGYGQEESRIKSTAAGFDHHLIKPVDVKVALNVIMTTKHS